MEKGVALREVDSSNVKAVGYENGVLTVVYKNNRSYNYYEVPEKVYADLLEAKSIGSYLANEVKGKFSTTPPEKEDGDTDVEQGNDVDGASEPDNTGSDDEADKGPADSENLSDDDSKPTSDSEASSDAPSNEADGGDEQPETAKPNADGQDKPETKNGDEEDAVKGIADKWRSILEHFKGTIYCQSSKREDDGVAIFTVDNEGGVIVEGTFLELYEATLTGKHPSEIYTHAPLQGPPTKEQSENLEIIRKELKKYEIDMQYERVEDKSGERFWNLKLSVDKKDRTLHYSTRIIENCTKSEVDETVDEVLKVFVKAA